MGTFTFFPCISSKLEVTTELNYFLKSRVLKKITTSQQSIVSTVSKPAITTNCHLIAKKVENVLLNLQHKTLILVNKMMFNAIMLHLSPSLSVKL